MWQGQGEGVEQRGGVERVGERGGGGEGGDEEVGGGGDEKRRMLDIQEEQ